MAGSVNKVTLLGNLGADPEVRNLPSGGKLVNLNVATSQSWNDRNTGERRERTEWHRVVIFNERLADVAEKYLSKGRSVYLEGELRTRKWTDQSGQDRYTTEVVIDRFRGDLVLLGGRGDNNGGGNNAGYGAPSSRGNNNFGAQDQNAQSGGFDKRGGWDAGDLDDNIPF